MTERKLLLGQWGENLAAKYLQKKGFKILSRNFACLPWGEIDIVAKRKDCLFFFEIKTVCQDSFALGPFHPGFKINFQKRRNLRRAIEIYLKRNSLLAPEICWQACLLVVVVNLKIKKVRLYHFSNILY